jgi:putative oxidoreductase
MSAPLRGLLTFLSRLLLCSIFFLAAVGHKIPNLDVVTARMNEAGVPVPYVLLAVAILFMIAGSISVVFGFKARFGALLLLLFLVPATYYFHPIWGSPAEAGHDGPTHFMKNLSIMGALLFIVCNGSGPWSLDAHSTSRVEVKKPTQEAVTV